MNTAPGDPIHAASVDETVDATLRLIARLPAPEGLEQRMQAALREAPASAKVLAWPTGGWQTGPMRDPMRNWLRTAAAAALAFVVAGGGWGVYRSVQPVLPSGAQAEPPHLTAPEGFSSAGAMRTPQTLNGPLAPAAKDAQAAKGLKAQAKPAAKMALKAKAAKKKAETKPAVAPAP